MSIEIFKMTIGIIGTIIFLVLLFRVILKPVEDTKLAILTIGRDVNEVTSQVYNKNLIKINTVKGLGTKSKTKDELLNDTTIQEDEETELLNDSTELLMYFNGVESDNTELLLQDNHEQVVISNDISYNNEIYDYTELINNS